MSDPTPTATELPPKDVEEQRLDGEEDAGRVEDVEEADDVEDATGDEQGEEDYEEEEEEDAEVILFSCDIRQVY